MALEVAHEGRLITRVMFAALAGMALFMNGACSLQTKCRCHGARKEGKQEALPSCEHPFGIVALRATAETEPLAQRAVQRSECFVVSAMTAEEAALRKGAGDKRIRPDYLLEIERATANKPATLSLTLRDIRSGIEVAHGSSAKEATEEAFTAAYAELVTGMKVLSSFDSGSDRPAPPAEASAPIAAGGGNERH